MAKKLTAAESTWQKTVLHDLFEAGELIKRSVRDAGSNRIIRMGEADNAKLICNEIKFRNFDFPKLDSALYSIARFVSFEQLHASGTRKNLTAAQIANIIASFCADQEIFWDDINTHRTTVEMDTYRMSILGKACWEFGCFLSQQADKKTKKPAARTSTPRAAGAAPKSGYKSSGPRSGEIKGLLGKPGEKITFSSSTIMYVIVCESSKPKTQYVYVDPISYKADPNMARLGDPSGYSACKLFFDKKEDAEFAITTIKSEYTIPDHITGFIVKRQGADANGYFKINTDLGPAYIKASKLNEEITEEMTEEPKTTARKSRFPEIDDIEMYSEAMHCYE